MGIYFRIVMSILDVIVATMMIYGFFVIVVRSKKMIFIINAITMFIIIYLLSNVLHLNIVSSILGNLYSWGIVLLFIIFQNEIRDTLESLGDMSTKSKKSPGNTNDFIVSITDTFYKMAEEKTGALITFQMDFSLAQYTEKAVKLDSEYSPYLLLSLFNKESPLHDGAVVIKDERIMYASTYYPIEIGINLDKKYGTRHRSAFTLSRETDAITVIISEERGSVSIAYKENLYADLEKDFVIEYLKNKLEN